MFFSAELEDRIDTDTDDISAMIRRHAGDVFCNRILSQWHSAVGSTLTPKVSPQRSANTAEMLSPDGSLSMVLDRWIDVDSLDISAMAQTYH